MDWFTNLGKLAGALLLVAILVWISRKFGPTDMTWAQGLEATKRWIGVALLVLTGKEASFAVGGNVTILAPVLAR